MTGIDSLSLNWLSCTSVICLANLSSDLNTVFAHLQKILDNSTSIWHDQCTVNCNLLKSILIRVLFKFARRSSLCLGWNSDHEEVRVPRLCHKSKAIVEGDHLINAVEGDLVAAQHLAQLHQRRDEP